jgi:beta-glucosidase
MGTADSARRAFPEGFIWGAATAAHQIEGNNVNSDFWFLENLEPTTFVERSGDACVIVMKRTSLCSPGSA